MRDKRRRQTLKIELLSQWKLEAEFRNFRPVGVLARARGLVALEQWRELGASILLLLRLNKSIPLQSQRITPLERSSLIQCENNILGLWTFVGSIWGV